MFVGASLPSCLWVMFYTQREVALASVGNSCPPSLCYLSMATTLHEHWEIWAYFSEVNTSPALYFQQVETYRCAFLKKTCRNKQLFCIIRSHHFCKWLVTWTWFCRSLKDDTRFMCKDTPGTQAILSMVVDLWPSVKKKIKLHLLHMCTHNLYKPRC